MGDGGCFFPRHFHSSGQMVVLHVNLCLCYMLSASLGSKLKVMWNHASQFFMQWPSPQEKGKTLRRRNGLHGCFSKSLSQSAWSQWDRKPKGHLLQTSTYQRQAYIITSAVYLSFYHRVTVATPVKRGALSLSQSLNQIGCVEWESSRLAGGLSVGLSSSLSFTDSLLTYLKTAALPWLPKINCYSGRGKRLS